MKSLFCLTLLLSSLSAFAFPEEYYFDRPLFQETKPVKSKVTISVDGDVVANLTTALDACEDAGLSKVVQFTAVPDAEGKYAVLSTVTCK